MSWQHCEESETVRTQRFWDMKGYTANWTPTAQTDLPQLANASTPQAWSKTGRMLFKNRQYLQAMHCYEHANLHRERDAAEAQYLRDRARKMPADSRREP